MKEMTKLYILEEDLPKINGKTGKVDTEFVRNNTTIGFSEYDTMIGASDKKLLPDDVPVWFDTSDAVDYDHYNVHGESYTVYFFEHGTEVKL